MLIHGGIFAAALAVQHRYSPASVQVGGTDVVLELVVDSPESVAAPSPGPAVAELESKQVDNRESPPSPSLASSAPEQSVSSLAPDFSATDASKEDVENWPEPSLSSDTSRETPAPSTGPAGSSLPSRPATSDGGSLASVSYLFNPKPLYPKEARKRKEQGLVLLAVTVTARGAAEAVEVIQSSGHALLDQSAVEAVKRWQFVPARIGTATTTSRVQIPIRFRLSG